MLPERKRAKPRLTGSRGRRWRAARPKNSSTAENMSEIGPMSNEYGLSMLFIL